MVGWAGVEPATNGLKVSLTFAGVVDPSVSEPHFRKYLFLSMSVSMKSFAWVKY